MIMKLPVLTRRANWRLAIVHKSGIVSAFYTQDSTRFVGAKLHMKVARGPNAAAC